MEFRSSRDAGVETPAPGAGVELVEPLAFSLVELPGFWAPLAVGF